MSTIEEINIQKYCRICFDSTSELISTFTKLIIGNFSCTIQEIVNSICLQENDPETYPKGICLSCKELVYSVIDLKTKYQTTTEILNNWFIRNTYKNQIECQVLSFKKELINEDDFETDLSLDVNDDNSNEIFNKETAYESPKQDKTNMVINKNNYNLKHVCPFCMVSLSNAVEMREHAIKHNRLRKYLKGNGISNKTRFLANERLRCTIFKNHTIVHSCPLCNEKLLSNKFKKHILEHRSMSEYPCDQCHRVFRKQNHLRSHITYSHRKEFPFECNECDKRFMIKENYDAHLLSHIKLDVFPYNCTKCSEGFRSKKQLYYHSFKHTEFGSFSAKYKTHRCRTCLKTFETSEFLTNHREQFHKKGTTKIELQINSNGLYECQYCTKTFGRRINLKQHIIKTHGPKKLCSLCGASVSNLKQHMVCHEEKRDPLQCHICQKLLASKLTLSRHIRVHTGEKPYKCGFCDKTFKDHYPMRVHERIHKGDKKHVCSICGKGFLEKSYMMKHFRAVHNK